MYLMSIEAHKVSTFKVPNRFLEIKMCYTVIQRNTICYNSNIMFIRTRTY